MLLFQLFICLKKDRVVPLAKIVEIIARTKYKNVINLERATVKSIILHHPSFHYLKEYIILSFLSNSP